MLRLFADHFQGVISDVFERDLAEKNWVLLIEEDQILRGFSTLLVYETRHAGEALTIVYSGDTIMDHRAWGSSALSCGWIGLCGRCGAAPSHRPAALAALSSGFAPTDFSPFSGDHLRFDAVPPPTARSADFLARQRLGERYRPARGIAQPEPPQVMRPELRKLPAHGDDPTFGSSERNPLG